MCERLVSCVVHAPRRLCNRSKPDVNRCKPDVPVAPPGGRGVGRGGQVCQVTPVVVTVAVRSRSWTSVWCRGQSRAPLVRSVGPPWRQCTTWWASHQVAGTVQPGRLQPWSRVVRARRWARVNRRRLRPRSRGSLLPPRTRGMISASQAIRRTTPGERTSPVRVVPLPRPLYPPLPPPPLPLPLPPPLYLP